MIIEIKRSSNTIARVRIEDSTRLTHRLCGEEVIKAAFSNHQAIVFQIGDYIEFGGECWYMNTLPDVKKKSNHEYQYTATFESALYDLAKVQYISGGTSDFYLYGNASTYLNLIVTNLNRVFGASVWSVDNVGASEYKNLYFSAENCLQVLQKLCREFEMEFYRDGKALGLISSIGFATSYTFSYGKGRGLYSLARKNVTSKNIITRLYALGSTRNLKSDYRNYSGRLKFDDGGKDYLEKNISTYGLVEHTKIFEECYPHRTGTISAVNGSDELEFSDSGMDFNLNDYLLPGVSAKVHFQDGNCGGYEFELTSYNNSTKTFRIIRQTDERGFSMPNATLKPAVGDKYVLVDIFLPQSYIDAAEADLQAKAQAYLDAYSSPRVAYGLDLDPKYISDNSVAIQVGDRVTVEDTDLGINKEVRIIGLTRSLVNTAKLQVELADEIEPQIISGIYTAVQDYTKKLDNSGVGLIERIRAAADGVFGRLIIRNDSAEQGGIAGTTKPGTGEVGLWLGSSYESRATAPFRVDHAGNMTAQSATIKGTIRTADETISANQAVVIDGNTNTIKFYISGSTTPVLIIDNNIYANSPGIKLQGPASMITLVDGNHYFRIFANGSFEASSFTNGANITGSIENYYEGPGDKIGLKAVATAGVSGTNGNCSGLIGEAASNHAPVNYGVQGRANGSGVENRGIYGWAGSGITNWAGYFDGNLKFTGKLYASAGLTAATKTKVLYIDPTTYEVTYGDAPQGGSGVTLNGGVNDRIVTAVDGSTIQGEANFIYDVVGNMAIGASSVPDSTFRIYSHGDANTSHSLHHYNHNAGAAARADVEAVAYTPTGAGKNYMQLVAWGSGHTGTLWGEALAKAAGLYCWGADPSKILFGTAASIPIIFGTAGVSRMQIKSDGDIDVITTKAAADLIVKVQNNGTTGNARAVLTLGVTSTGYGLFGLYAFGNTYSGTIYGLTAAKTSLVYSGLNADKLILHAGAAAASIYFIINSTQRWQIDSSGNYIAYANTQYVQTKNIRAKDTGGIYFQVSGGTNYWYMANTGDFHAEGDVIAYSTSVSDKRLKKNISRISGALWKIRFLEGVSFEYRKKDDGRHFGVIAQDVEKVLPEVVSEKRLPLHTGDTKKYKTVRYQEIVPVLIEAIKEQQEQIEDLRTQIGELRNMSRTE